ncbi:MAG: hypothetical protein ABSB00_03415 [Minisyncoccia bacterium]|jgi:hypothetical protein
MNKLYRQGSIMLLVLVFGGVFFTVLLALSGFVIAQNHLQELTREQSEAFAIAEAGIEYYRWFLSHFPDNTTDGTGHSGPYVTTYADPEYGTAGTYSLSIVSNGACGTVQSMSVTSTGVPNDAPGVSSKIVARFAEPSVAAYSYIVNSSVWAGSDRIINGPYHDNGGIRMDGTANAPVSSSLSTWDCTSDFGCSPEQRSAPGVVGTGTNQNLWVYPTPQVDFSGIASNFTALKATAQANGIYLPRYSTSSGHNANPNLGYHLIFNSNGTVTINKVTSVTGLSIQPINTTDSSTDYTLINAESFYETLPIPAQCGLIFVEDNTWIEGVVPGKITVVAANVTTTGVTPSVVLHNNITYAATDGSDGLTVISANDILIAPDSPQNMTLDGIFVAQSGAFGRNLYSCPGPYEPRGTLTILGSTISNLRTGTRWVNGCGSSDGGYQTRIDAFDRQNSTNPPPFTPFTSTQWQFVDWQQK